MPLTPGQTLSSYEILGSLGVGAMGEVYRARDTRLEREVAIKVLPEHFADDDERLRRFEREARSLASLNHPNVAQIHGVDQVGETCFLVLELVPGETLEDRIARGAIPLADALDVCGQIAEGLEAAHEAGVIHRDLKPANVRITPDGKVKLLDFGLAKPTAADATKGSTKDSVLSTEAGRLLGTPTYMAPEQARGRPVDRRVDVWAFGCVLYECLTARRAFGGETLSDVLAAVLEKEPDWRRLPPATPAHVRELLARSLAKDPRARLRDVGDAGLMLASPVGGIAPEAPRVRGVQSRRGVLATLLVAGLTFVLGWLLRPAPSAGEPPRVTQLTFSGDDQQPDVSPDGRLIAFTSARTGISQVWLRQVKGGSEQALTEGPDWRPRFSPDGTSVTFIRSLGNVHAAFRVPVVGGQPRKLIEDVTEVDWSPDGRTLAFVRSGGVGGSERGSQLGRLDLETGREEILQRLEGYDFFGLRWSPDGSRLCLTRSNIQGGAGAWCTLLFDSATGAVEELGVGGASGRLSGAAWAGPSALVLAISSTTVSGTPLPSPIVRYDLGTRRSDVLLWSMGLFPFGGSWRSTTQLALVDDASLIFDTFRYSETLHELVVADGTVTSPRQVLGGTAIDRQPCYHPDGDRVLFTSNRAGNVDLFSYEPATQRLLQLTEHPGSDWDGAYTPDGSSILWSSERSGHLEIWIADADGSNPRQLSSDGFDAENPTMTPDGAWVVYSSGSPDHPGIFKVRADGTDTRMVVPGNYTQPEVSPDGRNVLYISRDNARLLNTVYVADLESGEPLPCEVEIPYDVRSPNVTYGRGRWMPSGDAIVYVGIDEEGHTGLWIQDFRTDHDTSETRRPLFQSDLVLESFAISPAGDRMIISTLHQVRALNRADLSSKLR